MKTILTFLATAIICFSTNAQIFINQTATGNNDGSSWQDAYTDIQMAIDNANTGDELWIAAGVYKPQVSTTPDFNFYSSNKALSFYGGFDGTETEVDQRDYNNNLTIFSGDINGDDVDDDYLNFRDDNSRHVLKVSHPNGNTLIDGITIQNGNAINTPVPNNGDFTLYRAGGVEMLATGTVRNCTFKQCSGNAGAALWTYGNAGVSELTVENCVFQNNNSLQGTFVVLSMLDPSISNCLFENNFAGTFGGGITFGNTNATISDCLFQNNETPSSQIGGGIFIFQNSGNIISNPTIDISNCEFNDNISGAGAGICFNNFYPGSIINIDSCYFSGNESNFASNNGGAGLTIQNIFDNFGGGISSISANISNCTLEDNESYAGGGAYFFSNQSTFELQISNTEFIDNFSETEGGAFVLDAINSIINATISNSIFSNNRATDGSVSTNTSLTNLSLSNILANQNIGGAAFINDGNMTLSNCTLLENSSGLQNNSGGDIDIQNTILYNFDQNYTGSEDNITSLGGNLSSDASLENVFIGAGNFADYNDTVPSLDMNFVPESGSICIDAGNPSNITATTDLAGQERIQGSQIDIGAFESGFNVGVSKLTKKQINIYPNPFTSEIHLSDSKDIENIRLLDASGKTVAEFSPSQRLLIAEQLPTGVYFLELNYSDFKIVEKLQKR